MPTIARLLEQEGVDIHSCDYIACNSGPGPFTTMRTVVATANGLAYGAHIPLVPFQAITLLARYSTSTATVCAALNAFCEEVYCVWYYPHTREVTSLQVYSVDAWIDALRQYIQQNPKQPLQYAGNAYEIYRTALIKAGIHIEPSQYKEDLPLAVYAQQSTLLWHTDQSQLKPIIPTYGKPYILRTL